VSLLGCKSSSQNTSGMSAELRLCSECSKYPANIHQIGVELGSTVGISCAVYKTMKADVDLA